MSAAPSVLIVGASARAAAFSALRAGLRPRCVDLFADADLAARCPVRRVSGRYPDGFLAAVADEPIVPWLYTGGLENHPRIVRTLAQRRPLWGNNADVLTAVRRPELLAEIAADVGLGALAISRTAASPERRWLVKPLAGSGGHGIQVWQPGEPVPPSAYVQEFVDGTAASIVLVANGHDVACLGMTLQLVGEPWLHAPPFRYCGSVGPIAVDAALAGRLMQLGTALTARTGLRGLFGVDGILRDGQFWPVEVNPRYPASVEVLEFATGLRAVDLHRRAQEPAVRVDIPSLAPREIVGKAIVYAPCDFAFPADGPWRGDLDPARPVTELPSFADVPHPGEPMLAGRPVFTRFARGATVADCLRRLRERAEEGVFGRSSSAR